MISVPTAWVSSENLFFEMISAYESIYKIGFRKLTVYDIYLFPFTLHEFDIEARWLFGDQDKQQFTEMCLKFAVFFIILYCTSAMREISIPNLCPTLRIVI